MDEGLLDYHLVILAYGYIPQILKVHDLKKYLNHILCYELILH